jgi:ATPase subunit of ABC transporter with duplicated ATPase domains
VPATIGFVFGCRSNILQEFRLQQENREAEARQRDEEFKRQQEKREAEAKERSEEFRRYQEKRDEEFRSHQAQLDRLRVAAEAREEETREFNREILLRNEKVYKAVIVELEKGAKQLEEGSKQIRANTQAVLRVLDRLDGPDGLAA